MENKVVDHLFRHQFGKMVAILSRHFGLNHLETIEDAVQDSFVKATLLWRNKIPDNPEAWLMKAAKNRTIDLLRKIASEQKRTQNLAFEEGEDTWKDLFLDHEIADNQLRMIFVACHPVLNPREQIAFALKTISGFSSKETATALLTKEETIKKRLSRAKKTIIQNRIQFDFPPKEQLHNRLTLTLKVIYLIFNEGFHSTNRKTLIKEELCGEALRLCTLLLKKEMLRTGSLYALFALLCFHSARLKSKVDDQGNIIDLKHQDRSKWYQPLIQMGFDALNKSMQFDDVSSYNYEAAIAWEHVKSLDFKSTNWHHILHWYNKLDDLQPSAYNTLNRAMVHLQLKQFEACKRDLDQIDSNTLEQRGYLYYASLSEYYQKIGRNDRSREAIDKAIADVSNVLEKRYLISKRKKMNQ